jgi:hypothetical protein
VPTDGGRGRSVRHPRVPAADWVELDEPAVRTEVRELSAAAGQLGLTQTELAANLSVGQAAQEARLPRTCVGRSASYRRFLLEARIAGEEQQQAGEAWVGDTPGGVIG